MCAVEETGKYSVSPSMIAIIIALIKSINCIVIKKLKDSNTNSNLLIL
jgi:hypothetical protein